jgi:hypothetical protein
MQSTINAILAPFQAKGIDAGCEFNGRYWEVWIGDCAGGRADGVALARELAEYQMRLKRPRTVYAPEPDVMARYTKEPEPVQVGHKEEPQDLEIPRFLAPSPEATVPTDLQALVEPGETTRGTQERLWKLYLELQGKLMLGLASTEEIGLHTILHGHLHWLAPPLEGET